MIVRLSALAALLAAASRASAFCPSALSPCVRRSGSLLAAPLDDEDDFDAPVTNQMTSGGAPHHYMVDVDVDDMAMEDECYLGKYGQHEECVDFDPIHDANAAAEAEMPDFASLKDEVSEKIELLDGQFVADLADRIRSFGRSLFSGDK